MLRALNNNDNNLPFPNPQWEWLRTLCKVLHRVHSIKIRNPGFDARNNLWLFYYYNQNPLGFCFLVQIRAFFYLILARIIKFKYERKNVKDSGHISKMMPSCKWPIRRGFGKNNSVLAGVPMSSFSCSLACRNSPSPSLPLLTPSTQANAILASQISMTTFYVNF